MMATANMLESSLPQRAMMLHHRAASASNAGRADEALELGIEATAINRQLAEECVEVFLPSLAMSLQALSVQYLLVGRASEAAQACEEAILAYRRILGAGQMLLEFETPAPWSPVIASDAQPCLLGLLITLGMGARLAVARADIDYALALLRERIFVIMWIEEIAPGALRGDPTDLAIKPYGEATLLLPSGLAKEAVSLGAWTLAETNRLLLRGADAPSKNRQTASPAFRFDTPHVAAAESAFCSGVYAETNDPDIAAALNDYGLALGVRHASGP